MWADDVAQGAVRVEFPQQEVIVDASAPGVRFLFDFWRVAQLNVQLS